MPVVTNVEWLSSLMYRLVEKQSMAPTVPEKNELKSKNEPKSNPPIARSGKDNGNMSWIEELFAMATLVSATV